MYANLLGQKAFHKMTDEDMAKIIDVTRNAYSQKIRTGRFTPEECKKYMIYFEKPFSYLFATDEELPHNDNKTA